MAEFKCVTETINDIQRTLNELQTALTDTLILARNIQAAINDPDNWQGEAQLVGAAFLDLVIQYHEKLSSGESGGPINEAIATLEEYLDNDNNFYTQWPEHQRLSEI